VADGPDPVRTKSEFFGRSSQSFVDLGGLHVFSSFALLLSDQQIFCDSKTEEGAFLILIERLSCRLISLPAASHYEGERWQYVNTPIDEVG
jgi:hypothetical protein